MVRAAIAAAVLAGVLTLGAGAAPASAAAPVPTKLVVKQGMLLWNPGPYDTLPFGIHLPVSTSFGWWVQIQRLDGTPVAGYVSFVSGGKPLCTATGVGFDHFPGDPASDWTCSPFTSPGPGLANALLLSPMEARFPGATYGGTTYLPSSVRLPLIGAGLP